MAMTLDDDRRELAKAEQRLFAALGIESRSQRVPLTDAPVDHVRVLEVGEASPLLLVHGAGMSAGLWAPLLMHLRGYRCIAVDLSGCGLTDAFDHRGVGLRRHGRSFLAGVLDALGLGAVPIVANSLGATYSLYLAASEPALVSHLALLGAPGVALPGGRGSLAMSLYSRPRLGPLISAVSPPLTPGAARRLLAGICGRPAMEALPDEMFEVVAATLRISEPTTRTLMPELFSGRAPLPHHALTEDELARVTASTRFVWGSEDRFQGPGARQTGGGGDAGRERDRGAGRPSPVVGRPRTLFRPDRGGHLLRARGRPHPGDTGSLSPEGLRSSSVRVDTARDARC